ncbi:UDP-N-acetylmuramoyl-L-alanyl-D-glutamate--2,6-diaminopimelate ligase [Dechloromonas sp. H13]|uniref:UDP-N-acetylmuramoyl-L-alanyl-D-glutamate--2, 6-diaminopimelate ligase n=1 Tax=Dechloromonas sp. H13 TaxID=2570193 RepID=UPI001292B88F|nr:UDP-N-acetylmuramoyl-L-alanyl-D-glutamate--2,6-diaminopimelate ligase [Dechloromonas sp. H13]
MNTPREILDRLAALGVKAAGVADDSRQVAPGDLFLAYPGDLADGRRYIGDALARGAAAVLWQAGGDFAWNPAWTAANLQVDALRALAGPLAHAVHGAPSEGLSLIAITGTNGKTTVSQFIAQVHVRRCAVIGTLGAGFPGALAETGFTTPEATTLMRLLAGFRRAGAEACALEASSIGIEEGRMNGARVDVAVFTNFTRDHLDYHGSMEAYAAAKRKLFIWPGLRTAIVNLDDALGRQLAGATTAATVLGYAIGDTGAAVRAEQLCETPQGQRFTLVLPDGSAVVETPLLGRYNVSNLLAVAAVLHDAGVVADDVARRLSNVHAPAGRLERLGCVGEPLVVVDYAHTPDALENVLLTLRAVANARGGRLEVVFGCGGDRDPGKRPQMGEVAVRLADRVLLTSDNPRGEDPERIIADIRAGAGTAESEVDRAEAIRRAICRAAVTDVVLLAGKGHEAYQERAGVRTPFSDLEQARLALDLRRHGKREVA